MEGQAELFIRATMTRKTNRLRANRALRRIDLYESLSSALSYKALPKNRSSKLDQGECVDVLPAMRQSD